MNHQEIIDQDIVEQYVLNRLSAADRQAFQEHVFECNACYEQALGTSRFVAGVRQASESGVLARASAKAAGSFWGAGWWRPVLAFSVAVLAIAVLVFAWFWLGRKSAPEPVAVTQPTQQNSPTGQPSINQGTTAGRANQNESGKDQQAKQTPPPGVERNNSPRPSPELLARANVPSVALESSRGAGSMAQLTIPADAKNVSLSIPVEPGHRFASFTVEVLTRQHEKIDSISGLRPNRSGSLRVIVPASRLSANDYRVRLSGISNGQSELLAEYDLRVVR